MSMPRMRSPPRSRGGPGIAFHLNPVGGKSPLTRSWAAGTELFSVKTLTFAIFIAVLLAINLFGNRAVKWANGISTVGKMSALSLFIAGGLWSSSRGM